mgnify:CR=1 FL=1
MSLYDSEIDSEVVSGPNTIWLQKQSSNAMRVRCTSLAGDAGPHYQMLSDHGFTVLPGNRERNYRNPSELIEELSECVAVIAGSEPYPSSLLAALPKLRVIARTGVGYDSIDLQACNERQIAVAITPGVNHHAVAEHTIAMLMAVARGFPDRDRFVRTGTWKRFNTPRVMGSTLGLMGLGRIGKAVAERAIGLGMQVIAHDPQIDQEYINHHKISSVSVDELLSRSDFVSLHLPAGEQTRHFINRETLSLMKAGAILINTARGSLIDEAALFEAMTSGHLRGAALDVFDAEPLPIDSPLLQLDRLLLSGHLAGLDEQAEQGTLSMSAETILKLYRGEWPKDVIVNHQDLKQWSW